MQKNRIALIPARGGSKRLSDKNIIPLKDKPIIGWTIEAALESGIFNKVCVSTDSENIGSIASKFGAEVLFRPNTLATDNSTVVEVCLWHLNEFSTENLFFEELFCLYATAPSRNAEDLRSVARILEEDGNINAVIGVTNFFYYPYQALTLNHDGFLEPYWKELSEKKRTSFPKLYADNGSTYAIKVPIFQKDKTFHLKKGLKPYYMEKTRSIDIDEKEDYDLLRKIF